MKKVSLFLAALLFFSILSKGLLAQNARLYGRVMLQAVEKKHRTFRGRIYRNRLSSHRNIPEDEKQTTSTYENIVISLYPLSFRATVKPLDHARILQKNAEFKPHVLAVTPGTIIDFINLDKFYHNVFSISPGARFNIGRRPTGTIVSEIINKVGEVKLFCDIHTQMNAIIYCVETPYFTTANKNGVYLLDNLLAGKYRIEVYHPEFDKISAVIELKENDNLEQSFTLTQ